MKTHIITRDQLDKDNYYIGSVNLSDFDGHLESEENLGYVKFKLGVSVKGYISFRAGSGINAGEGIECDGVLSFAKQLFAGTSVYRDTSNEIKTIVCGKLDGGVVCYGDVTETGIPEEKVDPKKEAIEKLEAALAILKA